MTATTTSSYKAVYDAIRAELAAETARRPGCPFDVWVLAERNCVLREVNRQRALLGFASVDIAIIERAERLALGHSDYVSKYAHAAADLVLCKQPEGR